MSLDSEAIQDILWWEEHVRTECTQLRKPPPSVFITSDSSKYMWGALRGTHTTGGFWDLTEQNFHINALEMKAVLLGLFSLCNNCYNSHIRIKTDSKTCMYYINARGGIRSIECNKIAIQIWEWALDRNNFLSAEHIPGKENVEADYLSRNQYDLGEWSLSTMTYHKIINHFNIIPSIDLFASRHNFKCTRYVAWQPDPYCLFVDTFAHLLEKDETFYAFPPFNLLIKFMSKVATEQLTGLVVVPCWSSQGFFPLMLDLLIDIPAKIKFSKSLLSHPFRDTHPMGHRLHLIACCISGKRVNQKAFQKRLQTFCKAAGEHHPSNNIRLTLKNGKFFVNHNISIQLPVL